MAEDKIAQRSASAGWKPFSAGFYGAAAAALVSTVVLVSFSVTKTGVASTIVSVLAVLASLASIVGIFQINVPRLPPISARVTEGAVYSILTLNVLVGTGWTGWSYYEAHRAVDVLAKVALSGNIDMRVTGAPATLDVPVPARRDDIELVFHVADHDKNIGNCAPFTELMVTRDLAGNTTTPMAANPDRPVRVALPTGSTRLHLDITLRDTDRMRNCGVDLTVTNARLRNG